MEDRKREENILTLPEAIGKNMCLMKLCGLFVHQYKIDENKQSKEMAQLGGLESCGRTDHVAKKEENQLMRVSKWHLVYCMLFLAFKLYGSPFYDVYELYNDIVSFNTSNMTALEQADFQFYSWLQFGSNLILKMQLLLYPIVALAMSIRRKAFYRCVVRDFTSSQLAINKFFGDYNSKRPENSPPLVFELVPKGHRRFNNIFTGFSIVVLTLLTASFAYQITMGFMSSSQSVFTSISEMIANIGYLLRVLDLLVFVYFYGNCLMALAAQFKAFNSYFDRLESDTVQKHKKKMAAHTPVVSYESAFLRYRNPRPQLSDVSLLTATGQSVDQKESYDFDLEDLRQLFNQLRENATRVDEFLKYMTTLMLITAIPITCIMLYLVLASDSSYSYLSSQVLLQSFIITLFEIAAFIGFPIYLSSTTSECTKNLYRLDLNKLKEKRGSEKLSIFLLQMNTQPVGINMFFGSILIDTSTTTTIVGIIVTYFLLILQIKDNLKDG